MSIPAEVVTELARYGVWSYSRLQILNECPLRHHLKYVQKKKEAANAESLYGSAVHQILSEINVQNVPGAYDFATLLRSTAIKLALPRKLIEQVAKNKDKIDRAIQWTATIPGVKSREHKFAVDQNLQNCAFFGPAVFFRGVVDLLAVDFKKVTIVDYKTSPHSKEMITHYKPQLDIYAWIYKQILQDIEVQTGLYFFHEELPEWITPEPDPTEFVVNLFRQAVNLADKTTPLPGSHCAYCGYKEEGCDAWGGNVAQRLEGPMGSAAAGGLAGNSE